MYEQGSAMSQLIVQRSLPLPSVVNWPDEGLINDDNDIGFKNTSIIYLSVYC